MGRSIVPASILAELILAVGAALALANLAVLVRERRRGPRATASRPNMKIVRLNLVLGTVLALWGLASLLASRGGS